MKEATGELNMTVITVIAIVAVGALFTTVVWPLVQKQIVQKTCDTYGSGYKATKLANSETTDANGNKISKYQCCKDNECIDPNS